MHPFTYVSVTTPQQALGERKANAAAKYLAGGTNLLDHVKLGVETPDRLVDINALPFAKVETLPNNGGVRIGATVRNSDLAYDETIRTKYPGLSEALLSGASPQLRNSATTAGNLLQRTRCYYFRDNVSPCNKRQPGSGCSAIGGFNRVHALLGTSEKCIASHPSDMCVAMAAFDAVIRITGPNGDRTVPINEFYVPYGDDPAKENVLAPGELITAVDLPAMPWFAKSHYLKTRDRASYEFALASAAVAIDKDGDKIRDIRIALGGVASKPWRAYTAEKMLKGKTLAGDSMSVIAEAAAAELAPAKPHEYNAFKIELCKRTIVRAVQHVWSMA